MRAQRVPTTTGQPDLFIALNGDLPLRDQQDLMERPFFSLSKNKRTKPIEYSVGENYVRVDALEKYGMATIWDADILIWAASQITAAIEQGLPHSRFFRAVPYELLTFIKRGTGGDHYGRLKSALDRLQTTSIVTSIRQGTRKEYHRFSWISEWKEIVDDNKRTVGIEFILPDWLYDGIVNQKLLLSIDPAYFKLTGGIERWLYRVVRKHGGKQSTCWAFTMRQLYEKSGSEARFSDFAIDIRKIAKRQSVPAYWLSLYTTEDDEEALHFLRRSRLPLWHEGAVPIEFTKRKTTPKLSVK